ncbi:aminotransferase class V-fold PLP-dependent enzyme [Flammeovirga sp. EKP202]|uniref:aminotransferase class V-fold PLP-dependent enzyme n=1 Tax=Flammeovirga sp. EKP202 TaxID=2770592 RepID=UPI00165FC8D7|nr:aminotransferase class V-fold PLP-dependent enzyme [Flammeovirga sp. EKP202]MBD0400405.1 alanine--glyoxylate aminotransferase family protein [Flammeovirga sp. EKP202]
MISFYPGPSKIEPLVGEYMQEAIDSQLIEYNHRSPQFMEMMKSCIKVVKEKLNIPKNYHVLFASSATECWEISAQSFDANFIHIYNGAFGKKWANYNEHINKSVTHIAYSPQKRISLNKIKIDKKQKNIFCLTNCETSNTTKVHSKTIQKLRSRFPKSLIFVDATSAMSGVNINWRSADFWYASVQKCFGLPAGLSVMVCSPKLLKEMKQEDFHYNSLHSIYQNNLKFQTTHTPNILNIFLLKKVMENRAFISKVYDHLRKRGNRVKKELIRLGFTPLISSSQLQSETVIGVKCDPNDLQKIKEKALENGILLGNGYGPWKNNSFRIANFPAHSDNDFEHLISFLKSLKKGDKS